MKRVVSYKKTQRVGKTQDRKSAVDFFRKEISETRSFIRELSKNRYVEIRSMPLVTKQAKENSRYIDF